MNGAEFLQGQLALKAWQDGGTEGLNGMLAVAHTIKRRVEAGWWGGDWARVLSNHRQWAANLKPYPDEVPDPRIWSFQCLLQEIPRIFNGQSVDDITVPRQSVLARPAPPALYYAGRLDLIDNPWFLENISRSPAHQRVSQVGQMWFWS